MNTSQWISVYLYYEPPFESFLLKAVKPCIKEAMQKHLAESYFFIRYFEKGSHIRLRFKTEQKLVRKTETYIKGYFTDYFADNPSHREKEDPVWFPNNSVQFIPYIPEVERYGGSVGVKIAEEQFKASSKAVLSILKEELSYEEILGQALELHISMVHALGMTSEQAKRFFSQIVNAYTHLIEKSGGMEELEKTLAYQDKQIFDYIKKWWKKSQSAWYKDMQNIGKKLFAAQKKGKLISPSSGTKQNSGEDLWIILESYVHMTNNRLGVARVDEPWLAYLLQKSLE